MNGNPFYKPDIAYLTKEGMTEENRLHDWIGCRGLPDGSFALDRKKDSRKKAAIYSWLGLSLNFSAVCFEPTTAIRETAPANI